VSDSPVINVAISRKSHSCQVISNSQTLFSAHNSKASCLLNLVLINPSVGTSREKSVFVLLGEDGVLSNVSVVMVLNTSAVNIFDSIAHFPYIHFLNLCIRGKSFSEHICLLWHLRESVASHDIRVKDLLALKIVWNCSHVLVKKALFNASFNLRNNCTGVHI